MKNKFLLKNSYIFLILISSICFGQNKSEVLINNIKNEEDIRKEGLIWYDNSDIIRANFNEKYKSVKFSNPKDIAFEYLKVKHNELGLNRDLNGLELVNSLKRDTKENFYFIQTYNDIPIFGTEVVLTVDSTKTVTYILNNCINLESIQNISEEVIIEKQEALEIALSNAEFNTDVEYTISKTYARFENKELILC